MKKIEILIICIVLLMIACFVCDCKKKPNPTLYILFDGDKIPPIIDQDNVTYIGMTKEQLDIVREHEEEIVRKIIEIESELKNEQTTIH